MLTRSPGHDSLQSSGLPGDVENLYPPTVAVDPAALGFGGLRDLVGRQSDTEFVKTVIGAWESLNPPDIDTNPQVKETFDSFTPFERYSYRLRVLDTFVGLNVMGHIVDAARSTLKEDPAQWSHY